MNCPELPYKTNKTITFNQPKVLFKNQQNLLQYSRTSRPVSSPVDLKLINLSHQVTLLAPLGCVIDNMLLTYRPGLHIIYGLRRNESL